MNVYKKEITMIKFINIIKYNRVWWLCDIILEGKLISYADWYFNEHMELLKKLEDNHD
tara:strand:+ start:79 stop:252 length:174 start_codon:yes stop_codon:yes gene_type:complete